MPQQNALPVIHFTLPLASETRWSDLLATLIATDPAPLCDLLGLDVLPSDVSIQREVVIEKKDRPDLILRAQGSVVAVIEVKVLSGLGHKQLQRYEQAEPDASHYVLLTPATLRIDARGTRWQSLTWEHLLDIYARSFDPWVRTTAEAWRAHLTGSLPRVDATTRWNELEEASSFVVGMKARATWVFENLELPTSVDSNVMGSSAGASDVVRMFCKAAVPGYWVLAEAEERLGVRSIPKVAGKTKPHVGPSVRVGLLQENVDTSAGFDWDYLHAMWPLMEHARTDWVQHRPRPRSEHDRANYQAMVAKGGPTFLGIGFGDAQTKISRQCVFGARFQIQPDIALGELARTLSETAKLLVEMAAVPAPGNSPILTG